jgi:hypothetical protein
MQIDHAIIADYAEVNGRKLYVMGGGWDTYRAASVPFQVRMALALGVRIEWPETNQPVQVAAHVENEDGQQVARINGTLQVGRPAGLPPGSSQLAQMAVNFGITFQQFGGYRVRIEAGLADMEPVVRIVPFRLVEKKA